MTITKPRSLVVLAAAAAMLLAACVPPGDPGTPERNTFLEVTAKDYAAGLGVQVILAGNSYTPKACGGYESRSYYDANHRLVACYSAGLSANLAHRGTRLMQAVGGAYASRLVEAGSTWFQYPINNRNGFIECFTELHGGNVYFLSYFPRSGDSRCPQSWMNKLGDIERWAPPNGAGWWPRS